MEVRIEGGELVFRVGLERLAWCLKHDDGPLRGCTVTSMRVLGHDIVQEALREDGAGLTPAIAWLESMAVAAMENGSTGIIPKEEPDEA